MHAKFHRAGRWTGETIAAAIEVHREVGPGLMEAVYQACLARELGVRSVPFKREVAIPVAYKGVEVMDPYRCDFLVDDSLVLETKAVEQILPVHKAQVLTYMRLLDAPLGLVLNFHEPVLRDGIVRLILKGADRA